jgi:hypothetical protein
MDQGTGTGVFQHPKRTIGAFFHIPETFAHIPAFGGTVLFNCVLVQNHLELKGETLYIGKPVYKKYDTAPIKLQAHGDPSEPVSFRNIWLRDLN